MKKLFKWANSNSATILNLMSVAVLVVAFSALSYDSGKKNGYKVGKVQEIINCQSNFNDRVKIEIKKMLPIELKNVR